LEKVFEKENVNRTVTTQVSKNYTYSKKRAKMSSSWVSKNAYVLIGVGLAVVVAAVGIASLARAVSGIF